MADDLRRFLADEPIRARAGGRLERTRKWVRRNPAVAGLLGLIVVLVAAAFASVSDALVEARRQQAIAQTRGDDLLAAQGKLTVAEASARELAEVSARDGYFSSVGLAQRLWLAGDVAAARQELGRCPDRFRQWEWTYLDRLCRDAGTTIPIRGLPLHLSSTPDGKYLVCGMVSDRVSLYRIADGTEVWKRPILGAMPPMLAVHRSGGRLAYVSPGPVGVKGPGRQVVRVVSIPDGAAQAEYPVPLLLLPDNPAVALAWGPDDRLVLGWFFQSADGTSVETWDPAAGKRVASGLAFRHPKGRAGRVETPIFSPDGLRLAAVAQEQGPGRPVARDPTDETAPFTGRLGVWDTATCKELATAPVEAGGQLGLAFSPDGRSLAWADGTRVAELDLDRPGPPRTLAAHAEPVWDVAYSPDGRLLASGGDDRVVRVWDRVAGREAYALRGRPPASSGWRSAPAGGRWRRPTAACSPPANGPSAGGPGPTRRPKRLSVRRPRGCRPAWH